MPSSHPAEELVAYQEKLGQRFAELVADIADGAAEDDADDAALVAFGWYRGTLLPLLKVDAGDLLPVGRRLAEPLADTLKALSVLVKSAFEELDSPDDSIAAAMVASRAQGLYQGYSAARAAFASAMLADELAVIVGAHPELVGGERTEPAATPTMPDPVAAPDPISGEEDLDVRALGHQARHGIILTKMQALTHTGRLVLVNDHDPLPLRYQADAMWPNQFEWTNLAEGPEEWRVAITRI